MEIGIVRTPPYPAIVQFHEKEQVITGRPETSPEFPLLVAKNIGLKKVQKDGWGPSLPGLLGIGLSKLQIIPLNFQVKD